MRTLTFCFLKSNEGVSIYPLFPSGKLEKPSLDFPSETGVEILRREMVIDDFVSHPPSLLIFDVLDVFVRRVEDGRLEIEILNAIQESVRVAFEAGLQNKPVPQDAIVAALRKDPLLRDLLDAFFQHGAATLWRGSEAFWLLYAEIRRFGLQQQAAVARLDPPYRSQDGQDT